MKDYAVAQKWVRLLDGHKVKELRNDAFIFHLVTISQTSDYAGGGCVELTHAGTTLEMMIRIQLLASNSLTLPRKWLWLWEVYNSMVVCYFWEPCLLLTLKPTGNGKWFAILETHAEVSQFEDAAIHRYLTVNAAVTFRTNVQYNR